jgi:hypothetical protein
MPEKKDLKASIQAALNNFETHPFVDAAYDFWKVLGYESQRRFEEVSYTYSEFTEAFSSRHQLREDKAPKDHWKKIHILFQLTDEEIREGLSKAWQIQLYGLNFETMQPDNMKSYLFCGIELIKENVSRTLLSMLTREINLCFAMPVLLVIKTGNRLTISLVNRRKSRKEVSQDVLEKVTLIKDINVVNPHRAHIDILSDISLHSLAESGYEISNFDTLHRAWGNVLNTEAINRRFYNNVKSWFENAREKVRFPILDDNSESARTENLIRLLTRMIFIWFMKEKNLVCDRLFDLDYLKKEVFNPSCKEHSVYYKAVLQNLFFATLNNEMSKDNPVFKRKFLPQTKLYKPGFMNQYYYRYARMLKDTDLALQLFEMTPYLNGGLFECLDDPDTKTRKDYFTNLPANKDLIYVPDDLFFGEDTKGNPKGLINIFKHYKFTVSENTPIEEEIALDPELLGKVFESLLSEWDPELQESKKKHTGSYYTPRDIVDHMVSEALITYLDTYCTERNYNISGKIKTLFDYSNFVPDFSEDEKRMLIKALSVVKILDPACGSGAFPMGMLHKIVYILGKLDPHNSLFKEEQIHIAQKAIEEDIIQASRIPDSEARKKAEDVLIERMERLEEAFSEEYELDYARKLYIIENCIYGVDIQPIAMQIAKLRFFVSLIIEQEKIPAKKNYGIIPLPNLETKLIAADSLIPMLRQIKNEVFYAEIEKLEHTLKDIRRKYFYSRSNTERSDLKKKDKKTRAEIRRIIKSYITGEIPEDLVKMIDWDPYEISKAASFFDPFWMFSLSNDEEDLLDVEDKEPSYNKTFDIVIGNPPYVRADNPAIKESRDAIKASGYYKTIWEKWDLYIPFLERSFKLLKKGGLFSYIISDAYMTAKYAQRSQEYFIKYSVINRIDFLSELRVFNAAVRNVIIQIQNRVDPDFIPVRSEHKEKFGNCMRMTDKPQSKLGLDVFRPFSTEAIGDFDNTITWGKVCYVSYGLRPSSDERYYKGEFKKEDLISNVSDKDHPLRYVEGKWINRYILETVKFLEWNTERSPSKLVRPTFQELYIPPKILSGGMSGAIYDESGLVCNHSITVSVLWKDLKTVNNKSISNSIRKDFMPSGNPVLFRNKLEKNSELFDLRYLLALINSRYVKYFLRTVKRSQIGVYPDDIKQIPVPVITKEKQIPFCALADYLTFINTQQSNIDSEYDNEFIINEFDRVLDAMVMELFFPKEIKDNQLVFIEPALSAFPAFEKNAGDSLYLSEIRKAFLKLNDRENPIRNALILMEIRLKDILAIIREAK